MKSATKSSEQHIEELDALRWRVAELEKRDAERKRGEEALKQSEARLHSLMEEAPVIICNADLKGKVTYVNKKFEEITGYSREEVIGRSWFGLDVFRKGSRKLLIKRMGEKLMGRPPSPVEIQFRRKTGEWIWVSGIGQLDKKYGKPAGFQVIAHDITERKQMEEALRESEERYRAIFETTGTATAIVKEDMTISLINQEFERRSGYSKKEIEGKKRWTEFVVKDDLERMKEYHRLRRIDPKAVPRQYEFRFINKHGEVRNVLISVDMIPGTTKSVASLLDITERKQAEEALREIAATYRELANSIADMFFAVNTDLRCTYWNKASEKLTGIPATEATGKSLYELFPKVQGLEITKLCLETLTTQQRQSIVAKYQLQCEHFFEISAFPSRGGVSVFIRDVTEHKRAEEVLRGSEEKLRLMFESLAEGITVTDLDGKIVQMNEAVVNMHGYDNKEELIGRSAFELIAEKDRARAMENLKRTLREGHSGSTELTLLRRDEGEFPAEWSATTLTDTSGSPVGFIAVTRDITERKRAEEREKKLQQELARCRTPHD